MSAYSEKEVRDKFLRQIKAIANEWSRYENKSNKERCEGVAFSILALIDGCSIGFPAINMLLAPHPDDKQYFTDNDEDYFEEGMLINNCCLHDLFYKS